MGSNITTDKLARSFRFDVSIGEGYLNSIGFNSISGIGDETDSLEYREGSDPDIIHEYDGLTTINEIDLEKGYIFDNTKIQKLLMWRYVGNETGSTIEVLGSKVDLSNVKNLDKRRMDVTIKVQNAENDNKGKWILKECSCRGLEFSDFDAESSDALIQTFTVKPEGINYKKL